MTTNFNKSDEQSINTQKFEIIGQETPGYSSFVKPPITKESFLTAKDPEEKFKEFLDSNRGGSYYMTIAKEPITIYRRWGNDGHEAGCFWTSEPKTIFQTIHDLSVLPSFENSLVHQSAITLPAGTVIYQYYAGPQQDDYKKTLGGDMQLYIPRSIIQVALSNTTKREEQWVGMKNERITVHSISDNTPMFDAQKTFLNDFEQSNKLDISNKCTSLYNSALSNSVPVAPHLIPNNTSNYTNINNLISNSSTTALKLQTDAPSIFGSGGGGDRGISAMDNINYTRSSQAERSERIINQNRWQSSFCNSAGITPSQSNMSAPWPGGVELLYSVKIKKDYGSLDIIDRFNVDADNSTIVIFHTSSSEYKLKLPIKITQNELSCLRHSCLKTSKKGLSLSLSIRDGIHVTTEGIGNVDGAKIVEKTLFDADMLLCHLIYGYNMYTCEKTEPKIVKSYKNPIDVEIELLHMDNSSQTAIKHRDNIKKFTRIDPYPKFTMKQHETLRYNPHINAIDWKTAKLITVGLRGFYSDFMGKIYSDDEGIRCLAQHPFVKDFEENYFDYLKEYEVLKRLHAYMMIVGLVLSMEKKNNNPSIVNTKDLKELAPVEFSPQLKILFRTKLELKEKFIETIEDETEKFMCYPTLASEWQEFNTEHSYELVIKLLIAIASGLFREKPVVKERIEIETYIIFHGLMIAKDKQLTQHEKEFFLKLFNMENLEETEFCSIELALAIRSAELVFGLSLKSELWRGVSVAIACLKTSLNLINKNITNNAQPSPNEELNKDEIKHIEDLVEDIKNDFTINEKQELLNLLYRLVSLFKKLLNFESHDADRNDYDRLASLWKDIGHKFTDNKKACMLICYLLARTQYFTLKSWSSPMADDERKKEKIFREIFKGFTLFMQSFMNTFHLIHTTYDNNIQRNLADFAMLPLECMVLLVQFAQEYDEGSKFMEAYVNALKQMAAIEKAIIQGDYLNSKLEDLLKVIYELKEKAQLIDFIQISCISDDILAFVYEKLGKVDLSRRWRDNFLLENKVEYKEILLYSEIEKMLKRLRNAKRRDTRVDVDTTRDYNPRSSDLSNSRSNRLSEDKGLMICYGCCFFISIIFFSIFFSELLSWR